MNIDWNFEKAAPSVLKYFSLMRPLCGNFSNFLSLRFYVKSISEILSTRIYFSCLYMFVTFINFFFFFSSHKSTLTTIEILVLSSWIPASKEFFYKMICHFFFKQQFFLFLQLKTAGWLQISITNHLINESPYTGKIQFSKD